MSSSEVRVVLVHGARADGSSWAKIIERLTVDGTKVTAAPLPLTSFRDDVAALDRMLERVAGLVVLVGHAYAGAIIAAPRDEKVKALVHVAALAPDQGEIVADVFYRTEPHSQAPKLAPDEHGLIYPPEAAFAAAFAHNASTAGSTCWRRSSDRYRTPASPFRWNGGCGGTGRAGSCWLSRIG